MSFEYAYKVMLVKQDAGSTDTTVIHASLDQPNLHGPREIVTHNKGAF
jgi:hypothetical protein